MYEASNRHAFSFCLFVFVGVLHLFLLLLSLLLLLLLLLLLFSLNQVICMDVLNCRIVFTCRIMRRCETPQGHEDVRQPWRTRSAMSQRVTIGRRVTKRVVWYDELDNDIRRWQRVM